MAIASGRSCRTKMSPPTRTDSSHKLRQYLKANKRTFAYQMVNPDVRDDMHKSRLHRSLFIEKIRPSRSTTQAEVSQSRFQWPDRSGCYQRRRPTTGFFLTGALCLSAGRLTRLPRHDRGPVPGGNRSAASCPCTVLRTGIIPFFRPMPLGFAWSFHTFRCMLHRTGKLTN